MTIRLKEKERYSHKLKERFDTAFQFNFEQPELQIEVPDYILNADVLEAIHRTELKAQYAKKG